MTIPDLYSAAKDEKEWLIEELQHSASWIEFRQQKHSDDEHDTSCAQALYELVEAINSLPLTHPLFWKLAEINHLYLQESDVVGLGNWLNETKCLLMQVCFSSFATPNALIERLVELAEEAQGVSWSTASFGSPRGP